MPRSVAVVLSAGASSRMGGRPKALLSAGARHDFLSLIAARAAAAGLRVIVVTGAHAREIALAHPDLEQVVNRRWRSGQWSSVKVGLRAALRASRVLIHPVDAPHVASSTWRRLSRSRGIAFHRGLPGHPVSLNAADVRRVLRSRATNLADALVALELPRIAVRDRAVLENLNAPDDL